ncbi:MAG: ATP-dependent helicase HrpB [Gammaproteobacteria bacterium RIFCSPLOWO2_02_FULL_57_10]|nr:MAG: ATP-dependent helicase HrpB [Gammaproteobacteria bacterium RIFCSPLOWO2_02_FULL_57_10]
MPIDAVLPALLEALERSTRCLLVAQPGAGKTTRVPLALICGSEPCSRSVQQNGDREQGSLPQSKGHSHGKWLLLEPRRVAARLAAGYMADQLGEPLGHTIGYRVRGESKVSKHTRLEVVTQGILTRMLQDDPSLEGITGIIFDEFHERSLEADLGLALALDVQQGLRDDLRLLVMSATLDVGALLQVLGADTPVIDCPGRTWPVTTLYRSPPLREPAEKHQAAVIREALASQEGDVLVFLPGQKEIHRLDRTLRESFAADVEILPLHGQLTLAQQQAVLNPVGAGPARDGVPHVFPERVPQRDQSRAGPAPTGWRRRIILSTAIAESSLTVPGVRIVIDAGLERVPVYQPRSGLTALETRRVNRASADQRRGRAGREAAGHCYRLWPEESPLAAHREPEMLQADLSAFVFELIRWGVQDPQQLSWVSAPPAPALTSARQLLQSLGLIQSDGQLSLLGKQCSRWPTHPRLAVMLEVAASLNALPLACWIVAWLEESAGGQEVDMEAILLKRPSTSGREPHGPEGRWLRTARQWANRAGCSLEVSNLDVLPKLLARAYTDRIARRQGQTSDAGKARYKLVTGGQALLPENHALAKEEFLVAVELDGDASGARIFHAVTLNRSQLDDCFPEARDWQPRIQWDNTAGRLIGEEVRQLGALVLEQRPLAKLPPEAIRAAMLEALRQRGQLPWSDEDTHLLGRLRLLHNVLGAPWPDTGDTALLTSLEDWLAPRLDGVTRFEQLERLPLGRFLLESLDWSLQQQLAQLAPTHIDVPSGSRIAVDYSGSEPVLAVKLQELFGQTHTPTIVNGRVPVLLHLLSPARRPVQVTRDLAGFWAGSYFEVRKDLRGRYPRHPWPDDPLQAEPTARAKKRGT